MICIVFPIFLSYLAYTDSAVNLLQHYKVRYLLFLAWPFLLHLVYILRCHQLVGPLILDMVERGKASVLHLCKRNFNGEADAAETEPDTG